MLFDARLWLLIGLSIAMLFTIEATEEFVEGSWPQLRRPTHGWDALGSTRPLWVAVAMLVLPGLVLTILNLAILVWQDLPYSSGQLLGTIFVIVAWMVFLASTMDVLGLGDYLEQVGFVAPVATLIILGIGDLLLLIALVDVFPDNIRALIP